MRTVSAKRAKQTKAAILALRDATKWKNKTIGTVAGCTEWMVDSWLRPKPKVVQEKYLAAFQFATGGYIAEDGVFRDLAGDWVKRGRKKVWVSRPFSRDTYQRWTERFDSQQQVVNLCQMWYTILNRIFLAALPNNPAGKSSIEQPSTLPLVIASLREWSQTVLRDFGLMSRYQAIKDDGMKFTQTLPKNK